MEWSVCDARAKHAEYAHVFRLPGYEDKRLHVCASLLNVCLWFGGGMAFY